MGIISELINNMSVRGIKRKLPAYLEVIRPLRPVEPYTCVVDPRTFDDPRLLATIQVYGTLETDPAFVNHVQAQLRSACSVIVHQERLPLFTIDGCTASKSSPRYRTLVQWGKSMKPEELRLPLLESPSDMLSRCLRHSFPKNSLRNYLVDHLSWTNHGRYLHNSDGSHHLALAIALIHQLGTPDLHAIDATVKKYVICRSTIKSLENIFGAYVIQSDEWYRLSNSLREYHIPYAHATLCHDRPIRDPAVAIFLDPDHSLTPLLRESFTYLATKGSACQLSEWIAKFRH